jgi:hypothetical protein
MSASAILESVVTKKSGDLITLFQQTMYQKIFEALNVRRQELAKTLFKEDQLDEISSRTAVSAKTKLMQNQKNLVNKYSPGFSSVDHDKLYQKMSPEDQAEWDKNKSSIQRTNKTIFDPKRQPQPQYKSIQQTYYNGPSGSYTGD